ncbi:MAG TPA: hypothetical protein ENH15_06390 [Actinobacteria bacterium]|nr:hypothetical protein [Actinomycetota bacterium]
MTDQDLGPQLRSYVDSGARTISAEEAIDRSRASRATIDRPPRRLAPAFGAAAVVVLLIGIAIAVGERGQTDTGRGDPTDTGQIGGTTDTTQVESRMPDFVGTMWTENSAFGLGVRFDGPIVVFDETSDATPGTIIATEPPAGTVLTERVELRIVVAGAERPTAVSTIAATDSSLPPPAPVASSECSVSDGPIGQIDLVIYLPCSLDSGRPAAIVRMTSDPTSSGDLVPYFFLETRLEALLDGATTAEIEAGFESAFGGETSSITVTVTEPLPFRVVVDFSQSPLDLSCGGQCSASDAAGIQIELIWNVFSDFDFVEGVQFAVNGDCAAFWASTGSDCQTFTRDLDFESLLADN